MVQEELFSGMDVAGREGDETGDGETNASRTFFLSRGS